MNEMAVEPRIDVLDSGFVILVDHMGNDDRIVRAARNSYGPGTKPKRVNDKLIHYLKKNDHTSPFEKVVFEFHIKCPIFVARQWRTYRTWSVNELSGRYSIMPNDVYIPERDRMRGQDSKNRQASGELLSDEAAEQCHAHIWEATVDAYQKYELLLDLGLARELARIVLPLAQYTEFYGTVNLHNLFHFLRQRNDEHAQWEIQEYSRAIEKLIEPVVPVAFQAFKEYCLRG